MTTTKSGTNTTSSHHDTIIIGAGMSGLACASRLLAHPSYQNQEKKSLLVLEARDRIGGRIESVHVNGCRLDTGANWIHGIGTKAEPNPLVGILPNKRTKELRRSVAFRPPPSTHGGRTTITESAAEHDWVKVDANNKAALDHQSSSDLVIPRNISGDLFYALFDVIGSLHEAACTTAPEDAFRTSMLEAISRTDYFKHAFTEIPPEYHETLRALPQFLENMEAGPLHSSSAEHGADHFLGLLEFALDDFEGDQVFVQDGYTAVVEEVGKDVIGQGLVRLGVEVKNIDWSATPIVISTSEGQYSAERVVCTIPLGVLKSHHVHSPSRTSDPIPPLFTPELPVEMVEAIQSLGFGTLDKIFLVYDHPWWTTEPYASIMKKGIVDRPLLNDDDHDAPSSTSPSPLEPTQPDSIWGFTSELAGLSISASGTATPGPRALSLVNLHSVTGVPALSCFVSCSNAAHVESLSDDAAGEIVHRALAAWFGREVPAPEAVHVTRWAGDRYSRGSYTHMVAGVSRTGHREVFQRALAVGVGQGGSGGEDEGEGNGKAKRRGKGELRWAGEHTSSNHFATVHGALLSGWREADAILASMEEENGL